MKKRQFQTIGFNDSSNESCEVRGLVFLQFPSHEFSSYMQLVLIYCLMCKNVRNVYNCGFILSCLILYDLLLNVYRDIIKENKAEKNVTEIFGAYGEPSAKSAHDM